MAAERSTPENGDMASRLSAEFSGRADDSESRTLGFAVITAAVDAAAAGPDDDAVAEAVTAIVEEPLHEVEALIERLTTQR